MKKLAILAFSLSIILGVLSCEKESLQKSPVNQEILHLKSSQLDRTVNNIIDSMSRHTSRSSLTPYRGPFNDKIVKDPGFRYVWIITDNGSLSSPPKVRLYGPNHQTYYATMIRHSNGNMWYWYSSLPLAGHWYWRYVSNNNQDLFGWSSYVDNTKVRINTNGISHLLWPFGEEDGSSWSDQKLWTMDCGHGCHAHIGNHYYSQDWNWNWLHGGTSADNGRILQSPVDGRVENISTYSTSYGTAYQIIVRQDYGSSYVRFMYGHIQSQPLVQRNDYVSAGQPIAKLGGTGAQSPHAHCMLLKSNGSSTEFLFDK